VPLEAFEQFAAKTAAATVQALSASNLRHAKFIDDSYEKQFNQQRREHTANFRAAAKTQKQEHDERVNTLKQEHEERVNTQKQEHEERVNTQKQEHEERVNTQKQEHEERVNTLKQEHEERVNTLKKEHEEKSSLQEKTIANLENQRDDLRNQRDDLRLRLGQARSELKMTERQYDQAEVKLHEKDEMIAKLRMQIQWLESCPRYVFPSLNRRLSFNIE
jgi:chromosome segregation ATPase